MDEKKRLSAGDTAPAFTLEDAEGHEVSLSDFAGSKVIVYFYPAAMTPGCTVQAVDFTAADEDFTGAGFHVVGISPDPREKLKKFAMRENITFPLLSNPERDVLEAYGAYGEKSMYGKTMVGVIRSTFIVDVAADGTGTIETAQYNVRAKGHVDKLRRELGLATA